MKKLSQNPKAKAAPGFWLLSQKVSKIQRLLFYLLILFIPTQLGLHFWPDFAFIKGIRIDYLSPTLYFTDTLILLLFAQFLIFNFKFELKLKILNFKLIFLMAFLLIGIMFSKSPQAGIYGLLKFLEFVFLGIYAAKNIGKIKFENVLLMFSIGIIFESFLAISQYVNRSSLQGIFYFFGERFFTSLTPGIANAALGGELVLRPYATFPHPNVLAGYLVIGMTLILSGIKNYESRIKRIILILTLIIGTIALFLTLSRIAIFLWLAIFSFYFVRKFMIRNSLFIILFLVGLLFLGLATPLGLRFTDIKITDESIIQRESLIQSSIAMIKDNPVFGTGLNNFLVNLPSSEIIQPVHNIFFLIAAETGIIGLSFFIWFLIKTYQRAHSSYLLLIISCCLLLGLFDHYLLTLQQGQLLLSFVLGLVWSQRQSK